MESLLIRLELKLNKLKANARKALVAYLVAGDPDLESTLELMHGFVSAGVDVIEVGVPFTDPIAEGPIIQSAHDRSLKKKITLKKIILLVEEFRKKDSNTPIILMGYLNTFLAYAEELNNIHNRGVDALLIVDIPGESNLNEVGIYNKSIASISLVSPTTSLSRVDGICKSSSGFIYYVTLRGVTGSEDLDIKDAKQNIENIRTKTILPIMAGFGIKTSKDAAYLSEVSDGVVIGSSLVEMIHRASDKKDYKYIYNYLNEISEAINK